MDPDRPPLLSVIVPTYERPAKTNRAVRSIVAQDIADLEVVVVDDGSPTPFLPEPDLAADRRVRILRQPVNRGAAAARNVGLAAARAPWLAFLDSDDVWPRDSLAPRLEQALAHGAHGNPFSVHACAVALLDETGAPASVREPHAASTVEAFASGCWFYPGSAVILPREAALQLGSQDESLPRLEDLDWFLRLALHGGELVVSPIVGAVIERSRRPSPAVVMESRKRLLAMWHGRRLSGELSQAAWRKLQAYLLVETAAAHWHGGNRSAALRDLARSMAFAPRRRLQLSPGWRIRPVQPGETDLGIEQSVRN